MKSFTHENRRRLTITTIVSVLFVAILTTTLVLLLKKDTTAPTNTIEVGKRIDTTLGGGRKLLNASVWDGSSSTKWTKGSGTEADPYLIESAANLVYLRDSVNSGTTYEGKCFLQTVDIDLNGQYWTPIRTFSIIYNGDEKTIGNLKLNCYKDYYHYKAFIIDMMPGAKISNLVLDFFDNIVNMCAGTTPAYYMSGLIAYGEGTKASNFIIDNVKVKNLKLILDVNNTSATVGGICAHADYATIKNCSVENIQIITEEACPRTLYLGSFASRVCNYSTILNCQSIDCIIDCKKSSGSPTLIVGGFVSTFSSYYEMENVRCNTEILLQSSISTSANCIGGIAGQCQMAEIIQAYFYGKITGETLSSSSNTTSTYRLVIGGIAGDCQSGELSQCIFEGLIDISARPSQVYIGGIYGYETSSRTATLSHCLSNGIINFSQAPLLESSYMSSYVGGIAGNVYSSSFRYLISNTKINVSGTKMLYTGVVVGKTSKTLSYIYGNSTRFQSTGTIENQGAFSEEELKIRDTYNFSAFNTYWIMAEIINDGIPYLSWAVSYAEVSATGKGTEANPFIIDSKSAWFSFVKYYNEYDYIDAYYWELTTDLDISTNQYGNSYTFVPVGFENGVKTGFNGHFNGKGHIISGLNIDAQYTNAGLFGRMSGTASVTNLNVTGTIAWDQAKYVGGVVGLMEDGATLTNCSFTGTITGYLNSDNHAVVGGLAGKYSADAITGSANYDCYIYGTDNHTTFNRFNSTYAVA